MSSWVQLLLVVLAACPRFAVAEGDPLPAALVELVRNSPISSAEDLQLLLLSDSVDGEDGNSAASGGHRLPRSLSAQPALLALCKVRTEVVEVTRAMLDRSNGNFMLWPPCVEVQRCSGCCNAKTLQCVPVVTHTRYLQVTKIEFINMRPAYAKAVVSVVDHVECRCQLAPAPKKKSFHRQLSSNQRQNQTLSQGHGQGQVKVHSKEELHQWDDLKQNQRTHLEDLLDEQWSSRGDTFPPVEGYSLPGEDPAQLEEAALFAPHWMHNSTRLQAESPEEVEGKDDRIADGNKTVSSEKDLLDGGHGFLLNSSEGRIDEESFGGDAGTQTHSPLRPEDKSEPVAGSRLRPTKEPNPDPRGQERRRNNETPDEERILKMEEMKLEEERKELLLLHKRLDEEKEILRQQQTKREDEERQKGKELASRHGKHHHRQLTPTHTPESTTSMTTTRKPPAPSGPRPPARPSQTRRRIRKNRKRISKAAMRAMLM